MNRYFGNKMDDNESFGGLRKHRFNAEYSGHLDVDSKKKYKAKRRSKDKRTDNFAV